MRGIIVGLLVLVGGVANAQYYGHESTYSLTQLQALLSGPQGPSTLEEVLAGIKKDSPEFFKNYVLMYRSRSFQASSKAAPRAILFNKDASFVVAFNGDPALRGFDRLEVMQFDSIAARYEFREVSVQNGRAKIGPPNPGLCLACHQSATRKGVDPRPNWEPYSRWPGAIGSEGSHFFETSFQSEIFRKEDAQHLADRVTEDQILANFIALAPGNTRYAMLDLSLNQDEIKDIPTRFTDMIGRANFRRVMRLARETAPEHYAQVDRIFEGAIRCEKFYVEEPILSVMEKRTPAADSDHFVVRDDRALRSRQREPKVSYETPDGFGGQRERIIIDPPKYPGLSPSEALYLMFESFGVDMSDWSTDFRTSGRLAFEERFGIPTNPADAARNAYEAMNPGRRESCEQIEVQATEQARHLLDIPNLPAVKPQPLINACIRCHVDQSGGQTPAIPFDKPAELTAALKAKAKTSNSGRTLLEEIQYRLSDFATLDEQMPKSLVRPTSAERYELIRYLESL